MSDSSKSETVSCTFGQGLEKVGSQGISFVVSVVLAPKNFGMIAPNDGVHRHLHRDGGFLFSDMPSENNKWRIFVAFFYQHCIESFSLRLSTLGCLFY